MMQWTVPSKVKLKKGRKRKKKLYSFLIIFRFDRGTFFLFFSLVLLIFIILWSKWRRDKLLTVSRPRQATAIRLFEHVDADRSQWVGFGRRDQAAVAGRDQRASDKVMPGIRLVSVEQRLWGRLVSMHLVLLIVLFLREFRVCRAEGWNKD